MLEYRQFNLVKALGRQPQVLWIHYCSNPVTSRRHHFVLVLYDLRLLQFFSLIPRWSLSRGEEVWYRSPIYDWELNNHLFSILTFDQLWVSMLILIDCTNKFLTRFQNYSKLGVERCERGGQFGTIFIVGSL